MKLLTAIILALTSTSAVNALLDPKMKAKGKQYFGTAIDAGHLSGSDQSNIKTIVGADFSVVTHENSLKWESVQRI